MSRLLTLQEVAERLGLAETPRAVYSLPIPRSPLSPRRTRWAEEDVEEYRREQQIPSPRTIALLAAEDVLATPQAAPTSPGVYFLIRRGRIMYVGQSINPLCRLGQHAAERNFDSFVVLPCKQEDLSTIEGGYILKFRPPWNKSGL